MMNVTIFIRATFIWAILGLMCFKAFPEAFIVNSLSEFENVQKKIKLNDSIVWEKGNYNDVHLIVEADGLFFLAEEPGGTIFSGNSTLEVEGDNNTISGFQFVGGKTEGDVIDISGDNNSVVHINIQSYDSHYYLRVRPNCQYNSISYCNFESKPETQESSVFQIEATEGLPGYHLVSHCTF